MAIRFACACGQKLKARDGTEGLQAQCPACGKWLRVPEVAKYEAVAEVPASAGERLKPESAPAADPAETPGRETPANREPAKTRVLVADSSPEHRQSTVRVLLDRNFTVLEAADGPTALEMIRNERPDAVLLNVRLEGMSGFQVIQQLRNPANALNRHVWDMPILMTTERLQGRDKQYSMSVGAHGYFVKPLQAAQVCAKLGRVTTRQHAH